MESLWFRSHVRASVLGAAPPLRYVPGTCGRAVALTVAVRPFSFPTFYDFLNSIAYFLKCVFEVRAQFWERKYITEKLYGLVCRIVDDCRRLYDLIAIIAERRHIIMDDKFDCRERARRRLGPNVQSFIDMLNVVSKRSITETVTIR